MILEGNLPSSIDKVKTIISISTTIHIVGDQKVSSCAVANPMGQAVEEHHRFSLFPQAHQRVNIGI